MPTRHPQLDLPRISPRRVAFGLLAVVAVLAMLSLAGQVARFCFGHPHLLGFVPAFCVDHESSVPTWYSSFALMGAGILTGLIAWAKCAVGDAYRWHWCVLTMLLVGMSVDEVAMFHEYPIYPLRAWLHAGGLLYYTWVLPGGLLVVAVGLAFARFFWHLPRPTKWHFLAAVSIYLGGALGVEMLSGLQADVYGEDNLGYAMITTAEEILEMLGVVLLIAALLDYLPSAVGCVRLWAADAPPQRDAATNCLTA